MKKSTKDLFKLQGGWGIKSLFQFVHAYWYLTKTDQYVKILVDGVSFSIKYLPHWFGRWAMGLVVPYYHGKVMRREDVKKVLTLNVDLRVTDDIAERVVPFEAARSIIVEHPDHIVVGDCPCRAYRGGKRPVLPKNMAYSIACSSVSHLSVSFSIMRKLIP